MAEVITLDLPFPPSVNGLYLNMKGKGRVKTPEYRLWEAVASAAARKSAGTASMTGAYAFHLRAQRPDKRRRDLANLEKATHDLCVKLGFVRDDSDCNRILLEWSDDAPSKDAQVRVWLISTR